MTNQSIPCPSYSDGSEVGTWPKPGQSVSSPKYLLENAGEKIRLRWDLKMQGIDQFKLFVAIFHNYIESVAAVEEKQRKAKKRQIRRVTTPDSSFEPLAIPLKQKTPDKFNSKADSVSDSFSDNRK